MIKNVVTLITDDLNGYFQHRFTVSEPKVIVSNLIGQDGSVPIGTDNRIICSVINIEQEDMLREKHLSRNTIANTPPIYLNLYLMFSSNFTDSNYLEGLHFLSSVISFFQSKPVFYHSNTPGFPPDTEKITAEIYNINVANLGNLWGAFGAKYMPSIVYKLRIIEIAGTQRLEEIQPIDGIKL